MKLKASFSCDRVESEKPNKGEKNDSPMGGVIGVILVVGIAVALVFMYIKFIKKGR